MVSLLLLQRPPLTFFVWGVCVGGWGELNNSHVCVECIYVSSKILWHFVLFFSAGNRDLNSSTASNFHQRINLNSLNNERAEVDACQNESSFFCSILLFPIPSGVSDRRVASWRRNRRHVEHSTSDFTVVAPFCPKLRKRRRWLKEQPSVPIYPRLIDSVRL